MSLPLAFSPGTLTLGPSLAAGSAFDAVAGMWESTGPVTLGAVNLTTVSFITAAVALLPDSTGVCHQSQDAVLWSSG